MGKHRLDVPQNQRRSLTRRRFLQVSGTGVGIYLVESRLGRPAPKPDYAPISATVSHTATVHRRDDMLDLGFLFYNLEVASTGHGPVLQRIDANAPTLVTVCFGPQWVGEAAFLDTTCPTVPTPPPFPALLSTSTSTTEFGAGSRLVFQIPDSIDTIPYTIEALLNWPQWIPTLPATASAPGTYFDVQNLVPPIEAPAETQTAIEAPWRMVLAPEPAATWGHALDPVTHDNRTELWHTRLAMPRSSTDRRADERTSAPHPTVRAVWSPDYEHAPELSTPFPSPSGSAKLRETMSRGDRSEIVTLTSDYSGLSSAPPIPVTAKALQLSPLGATVDLEGSWPAKYLPLPTGGGRTDLVFWKHRGTQGRDNYVRVVKEGFLMPFRHRAVFVEESIRRVDQTPANGPVAYVHQRLFIVVLEARKSYSAFGTPAAGQPSGGRDFPFATVQLLTLSTPPLNAPTQTDPDALFWPQIDASCTGGSSAQDFLWTIVATDQLGQQVHLRMPLAFVLGDGSPLAVSNYVAADPSRLNIDLHGQQVCFAPPSKPGATTFATHVVSFSASSPDTDVNNQVPDGEAKFFPTFFQAQVQLDAVAAMTGLSDSPPTIRFDKDYVDGGYANSQVAQTGVFARLKDSVPLLVLDTSASGGIAAPAVNLAGLSRDLGTIGGDLTKQDPFADLKNASFKPESFFTGTNPVPMIFGNTKLTDILDEVSGLTPPDPNLGPDVRVPGLTNELLYDNGKDQPPTALQTRYHWQPVLKQGPEGSPIFDPNYTTASGDNTPASFILDILLKTPVGDPSKRTSTITGDLKNFTISLPDIEGAFIALGFQRLSFRSTNGGKPSVDVKLGTVTFKGDLEFVNKLEEFLKFPGTGLSIDLEPSSVAANLTLALPNIGIGVFSLENLSFTAGVVIPFDGTPVLAHFAFCTRENPFLLSVAIFGGGGFLGLYVDAKQVEILEISLEFGGNVAFDIVVASGGVHVLAGIYFKLDNTGPSVAVTLTGFVKIGGALNVLGLVSLTLEFDMSLSYLSATKSAVGEASLTVSIDVAFVSIPVSMSVRKEFGGGGDPTFAQMLTQSDWTHYCDAFAA